MRIYQYLLILCFGLSSTFLNANIPKSGPSSIDIAKAKAIQENKMLFVDFYASWCAPCKWMEETTFSDPNVLKHLEDSYVSIKINIDDFDGYALKEQYKVRVLPTILIFNHEGKIVERIEETLSSTNMINILQNNKQNLAVKLHSPNIAPTKVKYASAYDSKEDEQVMNVSPNSYKLQLGVFNSYENTLNFYKKLKGAITTKTIIVLNDYIGDRVVYRVLLGNFSNTTDAEIYKTDLSNNLGIESNLFF